MKRKADIGKFRMTDKSRGIERGGEEANKDILLIKKFITLEQSILSDDIYIIIKYTTF